MRHTDPRPTAPTARPDLSPDLTRASAAGRVAYDEPQNWTVDPVDGFVYRIEHCLCGGILSVPWPSPDRVLEAAVLTHNTSLLHATWRMGRGL